MERSVGAIAIVALLFLSVTCAVAQEVAPDFTLTDIDGVRFTLSDHRGKVVILNFVACDCRYAWIGIHYMQLLHEEFGEDLVIASISPVDGVEDLRKFREDHEIDWTLARDDVGLKQLYNLSFPCWMVMIIDKQGVIRYEHVGFKEGFILRYEVIMLLQEFQVTADVAVADVKPRRTILPGNTSTSISVTIYNLGLANATFNVTLYCNSTQIDTQAVILEAQKSTLLEFQWTTPSLLGTYKIEAVASRVQGENDLEDNSLSFNPIQISIQSDINGDGEVNILDLSAAAVAFATKSGDEKWNPNADVDEDQTVNILDLAAIATEYGKTSF